MGGTAGRSEVIRVAELGDDAPLSRASARELLSRKDRLDEVVLDFANVRLIGQAFADEIFRVFVSEHPAVHITPINASEPVAMMIRRARAGC